MVTRGSVRIAGKEEHMEVSKSTIDNWIAADSPHYKDNIRRHLRRSGHKTKSSSVPVKTIITNRIFIDKRLTETNGQRVGDWEMDTIADRERGKGAIGTLVDRKICYMLMEKLNTSKQAGPLAHTVVRLLRESGAPARKITTDNGTEFAAYEIIARELNTPRLLYTSSL